MPVTIKRLGTCPDLLALHASDPARYPFLLESTGGTPTLARYDILFAFPGSELTLDARWHLRGHTGQCDGDFLHALDDAWRSAAPAGRCESVPPFSGGWFVFLAYELARQVEPGLSLETEPGVPLAAAVRIPAAVVHDRLRDVSYAVAERDHAALLDEIALDIGRLPHHVATAGDPLVEGDVQEPDPGAFLAALRTTRRHIELGDIYQANISRRWEGRIGSGVQPWMLYKRLRRTNPAPFSGLALLGDVAIVSSSPERLVRVRDRQVETRPIAGTYPRDAHGSDRERRRLLVDNPKERAEHVMLIDLERNDIGRVCEAGSVQVSEFMAVESYAHVHHIVSNVTGRLRPETSPGAVLRALFPGGTITGCPKVRCMQIIAAVEGQPRGVYTGTMGYLNRDGSCDFNILIRTITLIGRRLLLSAGSGIVADSVPERELEETRAKARGMLLALAG